MTRFIFHLPANEAVSPSQDRVNKGEENAKNHKTPTHGHL